jgi:hypothetical protein
MSLLPAGKELKVTVAVATKEPMHKTANPVNNVNTGFFIRERHAIGVRRACQEESAQANSLVLPCHLGNRIIRCLELAPTYFPLRSCAARRINLRPALRTPRRLMTQHHPRAGVIEKYFIGLKQRTMIPIPAGAVPGICARRIDSAGKFPKRLKHKSLPSRPKTAPRKMARAD